MRRLFRPHTPMKLKSYLTLSTVATTSAIVVMVAVASLFFLRQSYQEGIEARGRELARVIAHDPFIIDAVIEQNRGSLVKRVQSYVESIRSRTDASYIVVVDKQAIRLSHADPKKVSHHFIGDDIYPVLENGSEYSTVAEGSLGLAIRNFVPITADGKTIGAICIGYLYEPTLAIIVRQLLNIASLIGVVYLLGIVATIAILYKVRRTFLDYEPEVIVNKFKEHELILDSIRDALVAVNANMTISTINNSAVRLLARGAQDKEDIIGFPISRLCASLGHLIIEGNKSYTQGHFHLGKAQFHASIYPIITANGLVGHVVIFFPELTQNDLEREVSYLKHYAELLRSKTHEYSNKLNVLSGMLQLGKYQESIDYIQQESDRYQSVINQIVTSVNDSAVAGLLLAKFNKSSEMNISFTIDADTHLDGYSKDISEKLVTIIGNILDNALLAAWQNRAQIQPELVIYLSDRTQFLIIEIQDTGAGIPQELSDSILDFGVSSKQSDEKSGIGLYLVKQLVDYFSGSIDWERTESNTTLFSIYLDKDAMTHDE